MLVVGFMMAETYLKHNVLQQRFAIGAAICLSFETAVRVAISLQPLQAMAPRKGQPGYTRHIRLQKARRRATALNKKKAAARRILGQEIGSLQQHIEDLQRHNNSQMHKVHQLEQMLLRERKTAAEESGRWARGAANLINERKAAETALKEWKKWWAAEKRRRKADKAQDSRSKHFADNYFESNNW